MVNGLDLMMLISLAVVLACVTTIIYKFARYFTDKKKITYQENNRQDIKVLEAKLMEIKLKNKGHDLDKNISCIFSDESVVFSMEWGDIIGSNDNL